MYNTGYTSVCLTNSSFALIVTVLMENTAFAATGWLKRSQDLTVRVYTQPALKKGKLERYHLGASRLCLGQVFKCRGIIPCATFLHVHS